MLKLISNHKSQKEYFMKKAIILSIISLLLYKTIYTTESNKQTRVAHGQQNIILESTVLHLFDGTSIGINANVIELIGLTRRETNKILVGKKKDGKRIGLYKLNGILYSVKELIKIKQQATLSSEKAQELQKCFLQAKNDVRKTFEPFLESIQKTKYYMTKLIEESCRKRKNMDSYLLNWAEEKPGAEEKSFNNNINTLEDLNKFCSDLLNFLGDMVRSCPKAQKQFVQRVKKCKKIHQIINILIRNIKINQKDSLKKAFMLYIKNDYIDKMELAKITKSKIKSLLAKFLKQYR